MREIETQEDWDDAEMERVLPGPGCTWCKCWADAVDDEEVPTCFKCQRRRARRARIARIQQGLVSPFWLLAEGTSRAFGGREEGGWWYDITTIEEVRKAWDWRDGLRHARELRDNHPTCRYGRGSVLGGTDIRIRAFRSPENFPEEGPFGRQRYE